MRKHPLVEFVRYVLLLAIVVTTMNPVVVVISLVFSTVITRCKLWLLDLWMFAAVVFIDLFSSLDGVTFLAYHNYHIITYEALVYGVISGLRLVSIVQISWQFSNNVKSDKLVIITSILAPPLSLIISMSVRNVRRYSVKLKEIFCTHMSLEESRSLPVKVVVAMRSLSILVDWTLENSMEIVESMENRQYGVYRRTYYRPVSVTYKDIAELVVYGVVVILYTCTVPDIRILPEISIGFSVINTVLVAVMFLYCLLEEHFEDKVRKDHL